MQARLSHGFVLSSLSTAVNGFLSKYRRVNKSDCGSADASPW